MKIKKLKTFIIGMSALNIMNFAIADTVICKYAVSEIDSKLNPPASEVTSIYGMKFAAISSIPTTFYKSVFQSCPVVDGKFGNPLVDIMIKKNDNNIYPILDKSIVTGKTIDFTKYVNNQYNSIFLLDNMAEILNTMLDVRKDFGQYQHDYPRTDLMLLTDEAILTIHSSKADSDIYVKMPSSYKEAQNLLKVALQSTTNIKKQILTEKEAALVSAFITRYDNQSGLSSIPSFLLDRLYPGEYGKFKSTDLPTLIDYERLSTGNIKVAITYNILGDLQIDKIRAQHIAPKNTSGILFTLNFVIDKNSIINSDGNGILNISISKSTPFSEFTLNSLYNNIDQAKIAEWIITKMPRVAIGYSREDYEHITDKFTFK